MNKQKSTTTVEQKYKQLNKQLNSCWIWQQQLTTKGSTQKGLQNSWQRKNSSWQLDLWGQQKNVQSSKVGSIRKQDRRARTATKLEQHLNKKWQPPRFTAILNSIIKGVVVKFEIEQNKIPKLKNWEKSIMCALFMFSGQLQKQEQCQFYMSV